MHGTRLLIVVSILCLCFLASSIGGVAGFLMDWETSTGNRFQAWTSRLWIQSTQGDYEAGVVPAQADTRSSPGDVGLAWDDGVYALQGGTTAFWRYGVAAESWAARANTLNGIGAGGALAYDGARYIYAFRGGNRTTFYRYDTTTNAWLTRRATSVAVNNGGALACAGTFVYAFHGNNTATFRRYRTGSDSWQNRRGTPRAVGAGAALVYDGTRYIYALRGGGQTGFWRYDTNRDRWTVRADAPATVNSGGALAYDGSGYIYAFQGNNSASFWRYSIAGDSWTAMTSAPGNVGAGGALAFGRGGYIYAFGGNGSNALWRYDVPNSAWTAMANALGSVNAGGALAFVPATTYITSATIASQVFDTGVPGDAWDAFIWDEALAASTDITFEVRASDTLFAPYTDNVTLPWISVGGTSPVSSGLPAGRSKQWRATLTTTDTAVTPLLNEVRLYYR